MTDHSAFLQAILANPDEDAPRLIYADWLEEQGDPRGEFIRLLCALAPLGRWDPQRPELEKQAQALLKEHRKAWLGEVATVAAAWKFERGLPVLTVDAATFLRQGELLAQAGVQSVRLINVKPHMEALAKSPHLASLTRLDLSEQFTLTDRDIALLAASPHVANLTALHVGYSPIGDVGLGAMAAAPYLSKLTRLGVSFCQITPKGIAALTASKHLHNLRHLALDKNPLSNEGMVQLAGWPGVANLIHLDLSSTGLGYDGAKALFTSPHLHGLEALLLGNNRLGQAKWFGRDGLAGVVQEAYFPNLAKLMLGSNDLYDQTILALAAAQLLETVQELYLAANQFGDLGVVALAGSPRVARLEGLVLGLNRGITLTGVKALASSPYLGRLRYLSLTGADLPIPALQALCKSKTLPKQMKLHLGADYVPYGASAHLRRSLDRRFDLGPMEAPSFVVEDYPGRRSEDADGDDD